MKVRSLKSLLVAVLSAILLLGAQVVLANEAPAEHGEAPKKEGGLSFNPGEVIFEHILDNHDFHFFDLVGENGEKHPVTLPLPVIIYSQEKGLVAFMSSKFEHGHASYQGYKLEEGKIHAENEAEKIIDLSLTRNVVQMMLALIILTVVLLRVAGKYKKGQGVISAPKGSQGLIEPIVGFVRDEVAKPNLGHKADRYLPYLLTVFFFILINNIFGLIPGSANVTGNIAFTMVLGVISFIVIMFSTNGHFWGHIFNPPVPAGIKLILVPVEILGIFIKPVALIIRLFANMVAGHIIIICLISLIFIFNDIFGSAAGLGSSVISVAFTIFIYFIEVLVAFLQAFIFTMLTAVFIGQAFEGEHAEGEHAAH